MCAVSPVRVRPRSCCCSVIGVSSLSNTAPAFAGGPPDTLCTHWAEGGRLSRPPSRCHGIAAMVSALSPFSLLDTPSPPFFPASSPAISPDQRPQPVILDVSRVVSSLAVMSLPLQVSTGGRRTPWAEGTTTTSGDGHLLVIQVSPTHSRHSLLLSHYKTTQHSCPSPLVTSFSQWCPSFLSISRVAAAQSSAAPLALRAELSTK